MTDFWKDMDYEMPEGVQEVKSEGGFEYYQHQPGIYLTVFGKLKAKYKDLNGDKCDPDAPGAHLTHFTVPLWITKYLGTTSEPQSKEVLAVKEDKILIPQVEQAAMLYFPLVISYDPKQQWTVHAKFESFHIPGQDALSIVKVNPAKPTEKTTNFKAFPAYYGSQIKLILDNKKSKKNNTYADSLELLTTAPRIEGNIMNTLEEEVQKMIEKEIASRQSDSDYTPPPAPSASSVLGADMGDFEEIS